MQVRHFQINLIIDGDPFDFSGEEGEYISDIDDYDSEEFTDRKPVIIIWPIVCKMRCSVPMS